MGSVKSLLKKDMLTITSEDFAKKLHLGDIRILKYGKKPYTFFAETKPLGQIFEVTAKSLDIKDFSKGGVFTMKELTDTAYCVKCHKKVIPNGGRYVNIIVSGKGTRKALTGNCPTCSTKVFKFMKG